MAAAVGSPEGVTNASITPEISSSTATPSAIPAVVRPCRARDSERVSGPGSIQDHPSRSPAPAATNTAVSSSRPCGVIRPKKRSARPLAARIPPESPTLTTFWSSTQSTGRMSTPVIRQTAASQALLVHTRAANDEAGSEL